MHAFQTRSHHAANDRRASHLRKADVSVAEAAANDDIARVGRIDWTQALRTSAVVDYLSGDRNGRDTVARAYDGLCSGFPDGVVMRRDVTRDRLAATTQTTAWASTGQNAIYGLVDLGLEESLGRRTFKVQSTGILFTRHAVQRRYERSPEGADAGLAMARELVGSRALLRLMVREAARLDMPHVPVPVGPGLLLGTLARYDYIPECASASVSVDAGSPVVRPTQGTCVAADRNRWTGVTYVDRTMMRIDQNRYAQIWRETLTSPLVARLSSVPESAVTDPASAYAEVGASLEQRLRTLLLMAVRTIGRD